MFFNTHLMQNLYNFLKIIKKLDYKIKLNQIYK
jgi:hypothetical protein